MKHNEVTVATKHDVKVKMSELKELTDNHSIEKTSIGSDSVISYNLHTKAPPPPTTPDSEFSFEFKYEEIPIFPDLDNLTIPIVKEIGIKACIEQLGEYFNCQHYKFNYLHFWFLDMITDCIWMCQDRFGFPDDITKLVLTWILFALDLVRGTLKILFH